MDLIFADSNRKDIGILQDYEFDLAYGANENDFALTLDLRNHCCQDDYVVYMVDTQNGFEAPTEYGGIIDSIEVNTTAHTVVYSGRTWHGILQKKIITPETGQDYRIVSGNAHEVINELISDAGLNTMFMADESVSPIEINNYRFKRYTDLYSGLSQMLADNGGKLLARYDNKMVVLTAVWLIDYSTSEEWDSSQVDFVIRENKNPVNHLVCLGQGDLRNRHVIHLFTDENGGVLPYTYTNNPLSDTDYIFDSRNQRIKGTAEVAEVYDNSTAQTTTNYAVMNTQPEDWWRNYRNYYVLNDKDFAQVEAVETTSFTVLTAQPSDWEDKYNTYFTADHKAVQGVQIESYDALSGKPADWEKNYSQYYVHFWDGVQWLWQTVSAKTWMDYVKQTAKPSDWQTNFSTYWFLEDKFETVKDKKGKIVKDSDGKAKKKKVGVGWAHVKKVKKGKKEVVPEWRKNKYYTGYSQSAAPAYNSGLLPKYKLNKATVAPTWQDNTYYTQTTSISAPPWRSGVYYRQLLDHYAELIYYGLERLREAQNTGNAISINLSLLGEYDIGDIVGADENITGVAVWQAITKKIVNIKNNKKTISYQIGSGL